jgi:hypothetical protein
MNINLILALAWLAGAVALFIYEHQTGERHLIISGTDLSIGWLLVALSLYNLARWVSTRSSRAAQRALQEAHAQRYRATHRPERRDEPPDPNFNFTDEPPPGTPGRHDHPPSDN